MWCRTSFGKWMSSSSMPIMPPSRSANTVHTLLICGFVGAFFCNHARTCAASLGSALAGAGALAVSHARTHAACVLAHRSLASVRKSTPVSCSALFVCTHRRRLARAQGQVQRGMAGTACSLCTHTTIPRSTQCTCTDVLRHVPAARTRALRAPTHARATITCTLKERRVGRMDPSTRFAPYAPPPHVNLSAHTPHTCVENWRTRVHVHTRVTKCPSAGMPHLRPVAVHFSVPNAALDLQAVPGAGVSFTVRLRAYRACHVRKGAHAGAAGPSIVPAGRKMSTGLGARYLGHHVTHRALCHARVRRDNPWLPR